ncbi:MAG TPA: hypothetical protein VG942_16730, partial [Hyphomonadaceae bacterium]|nr:hypothetical protein [Hyphomonadaceae bacterium]
REQDEAQNLFDALSKDPKLKMVVHSGAAHAWESPLPDASSKGAWMAARFKLLSGIDPLTISQIECVSTNGKEVLAAHRLKEDGTIDPDNHTDLIIGHPPTLFTDGRPAWRRNAGDLAVPAPSTLLPVTEPTILEARREADGLGVMPVDRLLLYPGDRLPLLLPPGRYRVDAFNAAGRVNNESVIVSVGR